MSAASFGLLNRQIERFAARESGAPAAEAAS